MAINESFQISIISGYEVSIGKGHDSTITWFFVNTLSKNVHLLHKYRE